MKRDGVERAGYIVAIYISLRELHYGKPDERAQKGNRALIQLSNTASHCRARRQHPSNTRLSYCYRPNSLRARAARAAPALLVRVALYPPTAPPCASPLTRMAGLPPVCPRAPPLPAGGGAAQWPSRSSRSGPAPPPAPPSTSSGAASPPPACPPSAGPSWTAGPPTRPSSPPSPTRSSRCPAAPQPRRTPAPPPPAARHERGGGARTRCGRPPGEGKYSGAGICRSSHRSGGTGARGMPTDAPRRQLSLIFTL